MAKNMDLVFISGKMDQFTKAGILKIAKKDMASLQPVITRSLKENGSQVREREEEY